MSGRGSGDGAQHLAGSWALSASILQADNALIGQVVMTEGGDVVYLARGPELIGRGVGHWASAGSLAGFELNIFQYVNTATECEPLNFRGIGLMPAGSTCFTGEFYICNSKFPRLVGRFAAFKKTTSSGLPDMPPDELPAYPKDLKQTLMSKLDRLTQPAPFSEPRWLNYRLDGIEDVFYVRNFLEPHQGDEFFTTVERECRYEKMATRDTDEFGSSTKCPCGRGLLKVDLPEWQHGLVSSLHALGVFHPVLYPANSVRVNAYAPGQGIHPHLDSPVYFPTVAVISLGSPCVLDFWPRLSEQDASSGFKWDYQKEVPSSPEIAPDERPQVSVFLEPGSLVVFRADAFTVNRHGIRAVEEDEIGPEVANSKDLGLSVGDKVQRSRRVSLTIRHLLPRCHCSP